MSDYGRHNQPFMQWWRDLLGLPHRKCSNFNYSDGGSIETCLPCLMRSPEWRKTLEAMRALKR